MSLIYRQNIILNYKLKLHKKYKNLNKCLMLTLNNSTKVGNPLWF